MCLLSQLTYAVGKTRHWCILWPLKAVTRPSTSVVATREPASEEEEDEEEAPEELGTWEDGKPSTLVSV